ncbi:MAG: class flavin-dependent oxidoreductase [Solirubrobacterales bacterium]|nr:class flavin-dependent oxidoreductase [Solirubrobacterales bacterium]
MTAQRQNPAYRPAVGRAPGDRGPTYLRHKTATSAGHGADSLQRVRIGLIFDLQMPRPWGAGDERLLLEQTLAQVQLADELGYASAWLQEHHFLEEFGHGGGILPVAGAAAARTTAIRLGVSVLSVDPLVRHPAVLAGDVAALDLLGDGRLDVATGIALAGVEVAGLGLVRQTARATWEHYTGVLARMLAEEPFGGVPASPSGPALARRTVLPRPVQRPHPPLWARCDRPADISTAARLGLGALCRAPMEPEEAAEWVAEYRAILRSASCVPLGATVEARVAVCLPMSVHEDEATAVSQGVDAAHFHAFATAHFERFGEHEPGVTDLWATFQQRREDVGLSRAAVVPDGGPLSVRVLRDGRAALRGAIGTPDQVGELVGRYAAAGVDDLLLLVPRGGTSAHEDICGSLRLFAERVLPTVPAAAPDRPPLGDAIRAALDRRPPAPVVAQTDTAVAALEEAPARDRMSGSAPAPAPAPAPAELRDRLRSRLAQRGTTAVRRAVERSDDRWVERTLGSDRGLRAIFSAMRSRYVAAESGGFVGVIAYELTGAAGTTRTWSIQITPAGARVVPGAIPDPALTVMLNVADFVRVAAGELDPGHLLLSGRMDLRGDFALATRLGAMFGQ